MADTENLWFNVG